MATKIVAVAVTAFMAFTNVAHGRTVYEISQVCGPNFLSDPKCRLSGSADASKLLATEGYLTFDVSNVQESEDCSSSGTDEYDNDQCKKLLCDPATDSCINMQPISRVPHYFRCKLGNTIPGSDFDKVCGSLECTGKVDDRDCGMQQVCGIVPTADSSCPSGFRYSTSLQPHARRSTSLKSRPWRSSDGAVQFSPIRCKKDSISYDSFQSDKTSTPIRFVPSSCDTQTEEGHECVCNVTVEPKLKCDCVEEAMLSNAARLILGRSHVSERQLIVEGSDDGQPSGYDCDEHLTCKEGLVCNEENKCEVCVDARSLEHIPAERLVFREHKRAGVLCDKNGSCATPPHVIVFNDVPMTMREYCRDHASGGCSRTVLLVNSPKYERAIRVPSKTQGLQYTAFAAQYGTWDAIAMKLAVRVGL